MLILIDGYNVIGPVAPPGRKNARYHQTRWLERARLRLIDEVAVGLGEALAQQTWIIFDSKRLISRLAIESNEPVERSVIQGITIEFSIGYDEADDRIEELILAHHTPKRLTVVSSDHRIQVAARRRGALAVDSDIWLDRLSEKRPLIAVPFAAGDHAATDIGDAMAADAEPMPELQMDTSSWLRYFDIENQTADWGNIDPSPPRIIDNPFPPGYGEDLLDD